MIDLHMHTTYSDGQFNVRELLRILNEKGIKYASITDHNSIEAHKEIKENINIIFSFLGVSIWRKDD